MLFQHICSSIYTCANLSPLRSICSKRIKQAQLVGETHEKNKGCRAGGACNAGLVVVKQEREGREIWWEDSQMLEQF